MKPGIGRARQSEIYIPGMGGVRPQIPTDLTQLEERARRTMSRRAFGYFAGGAGTQDSVARNRSAFADRRLVPRMLQDVSVRDSRTELFGQSLSAPLLLSPVGVLELAHKEADRAVARAAAAEAVPLVVSNQASVSMEEIAREMGDAPRWFQLYWSTSDELVESLVARAERSGYSAIVVTLDTTLLGWRPMDLDAAYLPFLEGKGIAQYTSDPAFLAALDEPLPQTDAPRPPLRPRLFRTLLRVLRSFPGGVRQGLRGGRARKAVQRFIATYSRPSLTWDDLAFLRERTKLPIVLKGILHPADARRALEHEVDAIWVSNHGGRQVDGAISPIEALPDVVSAVEGRLPVLMDGGVRGGADMIKARALGAHLVGIGRPYAYGLALAGERGVQEVIRNMKADLDLTMGLCGMSAISDITTEVLA